MKKVVFTLFIFLLVLPVKSQDLLPFVENFTKSEYSGDNQNWNITQGQDQAIYFANNHFFLRYNGVKWEKYTLPNQTIIRSLFVDGDQIYCGSYKEFGYWKRIRGNMKYFSLSENLNLFTGKSENEEIWKIFKHQDQIYFQSFNELFIYGKNGLEKFRFPFQISYCYLVDGKIYVASVRKGIYLLEHNKIIKKENWSAIADNVIHGIEKHNGQLYIFTKNNGIYYEKDEKLVAWENPLNEQLKKEVILTAKFVNSDKLAIGTTLKGLYVVDWKDGSFQNFNRENSLRNNAVLSIATDKENDLWLGLDNGIAHVEINSPVSIFTDNSGQLGSVYSLSTINNGYLFVTNHGIFLHQDKKLEAVPNSQGQVWDIYKLNNQFLIGHNDGTFMFDGTRLKKLNTVNGGWKFLKSGFHNAYFQGNYSGIAYYKEGDDFTKWQFLDGLTKPIRNLAQNQPNELWAAENYRGLYRIVFDDHFKTQSVENISQKNGLENDYGVKMFSYKNEILFLIDKSWYTYHSISGKLVKDSMFNTYFKNISDIIPIDDQHFVVQQSGLLYLIKQQDNQFEWELIPEKYYQGRIIFENTKAYKEQDRILLNLDDGFISYQLNKSKRIPEKVTVEGFYQGQLMTPGTRVKHNQSVILNLVSGFYGYNRHDFFYRLNGGNDYIRIDKGNMVLNNLISGQQDLVFYYFNGKQHIPIATYEFTVDSPWYFSIGMILFYILIIAGSFVLYYKWNKLRYLQKLKLQEEELKHQKKILEIELKAENELNVQEYEKHILELEIQAKSTEVAGKSLSIAKQSEMIENIQMILDNENDLNRLKSAIKKAIKINEVNKHEWEAFETNLNQINNEFISKLSKQYPNLTPKDIKLCIYLKMNLTSKEIAPLLNISFRGVELHRYRLRKKLGLHQEENLTKFILAL